MQKYIKSTHTQTFIRRALRLRFRLSILPPYEKVWLRTVSAGFAGLVLMSFLTPLQAQETPPRNDNIHFGLSIGGACNTTFAAPGPWSFDIPQTKIGVSGGAYFKYDFAKRFFAHIELNISSRKLSANGSSADTTRNNFDLSYQYTNISAPIGIGVSFLPNSSKMNASLTACVVVGMPQHNKSEISANYQDVEQAINPIGVGAMLNLRIQYSFVFLDFRYEFIGTPVFKYQNQAFRTGTFSFLLGFQIF